jgi:hypothetical protein
MGLAQAAVSDEVSKIISGFHRRRQPLLPHKQRIK